MSRIHLKVLATALSVKSIDSQELMSKSSWWTQTYSCNRTLLISSQIHVLKATYKSFVRRSTRKRNQSHESRPETSPPYFTSNFLSKSWKSSPQRCALKVSIHKEQALMKQQRNICRRESWSSYKLFRPLKSAECRNYLCLVSFHQVAIHLVRVISWRSKARCMWALCWGPRAPRLRAKKRRARLSWSITITCRRKSTRREVLSLGQVIIILRAPHQSLNRTSSNLLSMLSDSSQWLPWLT